MKPLTPISSLVEIIFLYVVESMNVYTSFFMGVMNVILIQSNNICLENNIKFVNLSFCG